MRLTLELYGHTFAVSCDGDDIDGDELKEMFTRLMAAAGYGPEVIENRDGTRYKCELVVDEY